MQVVFLDGGERWYYDDEKWVEQFFNGEQRCDEKRWWWMIRWCDDMKVKMMDAWNGDDEWWDDGAMCPITPPKTPILLLDTPYWSLLCINFCSFTKHLQKQTLHHVCKRQMYPFSHNHRSGKLPEMKGN